MAKNNAQKPKKKQKTDWRRVMMTALAALMALALVLPLLASILPAQAATQDELKDQISGLKDDAASAKDRLKELEAELAAVTKDKKKAMERKNILDKQIYALNEQIENTQGQIDAYTALIAEQEVTLADAQAREEAAYQRFCERARSMEEAGTVSYWSVLFAAKDYADLLDRLALVDEIMEYDNNVVETLAAAREEETRILVDLNATKADLDVQKAELDSQHEVLEGKIEEAQALLDELKEQEDYHEQLVAAEKAELAQIDKDLAKKEKELKDLIAKANFTTGSGYFYPLPIERTYVTSRFGPRTDPITGKLNSNHGGMDIPANTGTPIYAVQGGVVITSTYAPASYGNYVAISHGTNEKGQTVVTLYGHMSKRAVKEGATVKQGQIIGYVGSTGRSTGPHLHLELRLNNVRSDPEKLFPKVKFTFKYNY